MALSRGRNDDVEDSTFLKRIITDDEAWVYE